MSEAARPVLDDDGYPTDETIAKIAAWPQADFRGLMEYVRQAWHFGDWGWNEDDDPDEPGRRYSISTAGWSGNENLIAAMQDNLMFWVMCWQQSRRGGHYIFAIRALATVEPKETP